MNIDGPAACDADNLKAALGQAGLSAISMGRTFETGDAQ